MAESATNDAIAVDRTATPHEIKQVAFKRAYRYNGVAMADIVDKATRSRMMKNIRGKNTKPELVVRRFLHGEGFRYRLHNRQLPGKPDLVLPKYHAVIFVHGCFWHRHKNCRLSYSPKSREAFWQEKFRQNVTRDAKAVDSLLESGWRVMTVWECGLRDSELREAGLDGVVAWLRSDWSRGEFPANGRMSTS